MKLKKYFIVLLLISLAPSAFAIMPVIDPTEIAKTIELIQKADNQVKQLTELSKLNTNQYKFLQNNLSGSFGYGSLFNNTKDLNKRQWSNDSWVDVLNAANTGHASVFSDAQRRYSQLYPIEQSDHIAPTRKNGGLVRTYYQQSSEISRATLAASSYSYDQINDHIQKLHDMLSKLDDQTSEKAAIDLNARLVAELGFIELELLKQQSFQNQLIATQTQGDVNGMSDQSKFMQWNPK